MVWDIQFGGAVTKGQAQVVWDMHTAWPTLAFAFGFSFAAYAILTYFMKARWGFSLKNPNEGMHPA